MSFEASFQRLFAVSYRIAARLLGGGPEAEDVAAEALTRAYLRWRRFHDEEHAEAWLVRVTTNLGIDILRKRARPLVIASPSPSADPDIRMLIEALVLELPRRQREVVALRYLADLAEADVARVLGISTGSVKRHLHRALGALRGSFVTDDVKGAFT